MKTLILGLGNPILGDDGVGLLIAGLVGKQLPPNMLIEVGQETCGGLRLMERLAGFDKAIIVDAIHTGTHPPGTLHHLKLNDINTQHSASVHDVNLPTAIQSAKPSASKCLMIFGLLPLRQKTRLILSRGVPRMSRPQSPRL